MMNFLAKTCSGLIATLLAVAPAWAQQYSGGSHRIVTPQGTLVINSGFVNNLNVHTFHVYSFLLKPSGDSDDGWQQVPVVESREDGALKFTLTTANTADFTLRDAKVAVVDGRVVLLVAHRRYKDTPYDDDASVEVRRYELRQTQDEERWIFQWISTWDAGGKASVEQALTSQQAVPRKKK